MKLETRGRNFNLNRGQKIAKGNWNMPQKPRPKGGCLDFIDSVVDSSIQNSNMGLGIVMK